LKDVPTEENKFAGNATKNIRERTSRFSKAVLM